MPPITIIFESKNGSSDKIASYIENELSPIPVKLFDLKKNANPIPPANSKIILGGSIYIGRIGKRLTKYIEKNQELLKTKTIGLYICCMYAAEEKTVFNNAFPDQIKANAAAKLIAGGEYNFERMNFIEKFMIKKITRHKTTVSEIRWNAVDEFIDTIKNNYG